MLPDSSLFLPSTVSLILNPSSHSETHKSFPKDIIEKINSGEITDIKLVSSSPTVNASGEKASRLVYRYTINYEKKEFIVTLSHSPSSKIVSDKTSHIYQQQLHLETTSLTTEEGVPEEDTPEEDNYETSPFNYSNTEDSLVKFRDTKPSENIALLVDKITLIQKRPLADLDILDLKELALMLNLDIESEIKSDQMFRMLVIKKISNFRDEAIALISDHELLGFSYGASLSLKYTYSILNREIKVRRLKNGGQSVIEDSFNDAILEQTLANILKSFRKGVLSRPEDIKLINHLIGMNKISAENMHLLISDENVHLLIKVIVEYLSEENYTSELKPMLSFLMENNSLPSLPDELKRIVNNIIGKIAFRDRSIIPDRYELKLSDYLQQELSRLTKPLVDINITRIELLLGKYDTSTPVQELIDLNVVIISSLKSLSVIEDLDFDLFNMPGFQTHLNLIKTFIDKAEGFSVADTGSSSLRLGLFNKTLQGLKKSVIKTSTAVLITEHSPSNDHIKALNNLSILLADPNLSLDLKKSIASELDTFSQSPFLNEESAICLKSIIKDLFKLHMIDGNKALNALYIKEATRLVSKERRLPYTDFNVQDATVTNQIFVSLETGVLSTIEKIKILEEFKSKLLNPILGDSVKLGIVSGFNREDNNEVKKADYFSDEKIKTYMRELLISAYESFDIGYVVKIEMLSILKEHLNDLSISDTDAIRIIKGLVSQAIRFSAEGNNEILEENSAVLIGKLNMYDELPSDVGEELISSLNEILNSPASIVPDLLKLNMIADIFSIQSSLPFNMINIIESMTSDPSVHPIISDEISLGLYQYNILMDSSSESEYQFGEINDNKPSDDEYQFGEMRS